MRGSLEGTRGITLKGLLVVIAVIVLAFLLLRPIFVKMGSGAISAACRSNLAKIGKAVQMYANDFSEFVPPAQWYGPEGAVSWRESLKEYLGADYPGVFRCSAKRQAEVGYAVNYLTFGRNVKGLTPPNSNCMTMKQIQSAGRTIYILDTGEVTEETKHEQPELWEETPEDAPTYCRCSKSDSHWADDPVRPMPRHAKKVNCLMLNGVVGEYRVEEIVNPDEKSDACLWDKY